MVTVFLAALAAPSTHCFQQSQISYAQPVYSQPVYAAPAVKYVAPVQHVTVFYGVGQSVQISALVSKQLRSDSEYQQFLKWKADKRTAAAQPQQPPPPMQETPPPTPTPATPPTQTQPVATVANSCARCHSGPAPKGNFLLDGQSPLPDIARPVEMIMTGAMPPLVGENGEQLDTHRLTPLERYQIIEDLIRLKTLGEQP